jgi:secreted trypsin-like serine protease
MQFKSLIFLIALLFALFSFAQAGKKIVGGSVASSGQFPYIVRLLITTFKGQFVCDGQIIDKYHVATAGHCLQYPFSGFPYYVQISYGSVSLSTASITYPISIIVHPLFSDQLSANSSLSYDVALLRFASPFTYSTTVNKIELETSLPSSGDDLILSGWGTIENGSLPDNLLWITLPYVSFSTCSKIYPDLNQDLHLCAGGTADNNGCQGDSGGPLVTFTDATNATTHKLLGIVSYNQPPCIDPTPAVFANVPGFAGDWLTATIADGSGCRKACRNEFILCKIFGILPQVHNRKVSTCRDFRRVCNKTCPKLVF